MAGHRQIAQDVALDIGRSRFYDFTRSEIKYNKIYIEPTNPKYNRILP